MKTAYKWFFEGAEDAGSDFVWPAPTNGPGEWVRMRKRLGREPTSAALDVDHLAHQMETELWEVELDDVGSSGYVLLAKRGRLVRKIEAWTPDAADEFATACLDRAEENANATLVMAEQGWPRQDVRQVIAAEASRELMDSIRAPTSFEQQFGPPPFLKPEGMDMLTSQSFGDPRLAPQMEADLDVYAMEHALSGIFYTALEAVRRATGTRKLFRSESFAGPASAFSRAGMAGDGALRAQRDIALAQVYERFSRGETGRGDWFQVMSRAWGEELATQSKWLADRLSLP